MFAKLSRYNAQSKQKFFLLHLGNCGAWMAHWVAFLVLGLSLALSGGSAYAKLMVQACTSCELDGGGTGVALKNHVRGQLLNGNDVVVILMDFSTQQNPTKQTIEQALGDIIQSSSTTNFTRGKEGPVTHVLTTSTISAYSNERGKEKERVKLYVYRIKQPTGMDGPYIDQEQNIVGDMRMLPDMQYTIDDIVNRVMQLGGNYKHGIYSYQMHVYWNMVLEKEIAKKLRLSCNWTSDVTECKRIPVVMWAHSDENAYSGKQPEDKRMSARIRAGVLLKDMISVSDAVFTVSTPSRNQFLNETDLVGYNLAVRKDDSIGQGPYFSLHEYDPKGKDVLVSFRANPQELCDPLQAGLNNPEACNRPYEKYVLPVFNGIKEPKPVVMVRSLWLKQMDTNYATWAKVDGNKVQEDGKSLIGDFTQESLSSSIKEGDKIVLSLGRINQSKNPLALVQNWDKVDSSNKTHLIIAGPPESDSPTSRTYFRDMLAAISQKNKQLGSPLIHYVGPVPSDQTATAYDQADAFVSPSTAETQGMTVLEAMAVGTPVVANVNVPSYTEFVKDGVNGFLDDPAQSGFYTKIAKIIANTNDVATVFAQRGPRTFSFYSIPGIANRTQWALDAVWARLNGPAPTFPLAETSKVPDWNYITQ